MQSFTRPEHCLCATPAASPVFLKDVIVLLVYVCDAWLGELGVVHKSLRQISHAEAAEQCFARREPFPVARRTHAVQSTRQVALHALADAPAR